MPALRVCHYPEGCHSREGITSIKPIHQLQCSVWDSWEAALDRKALQLPQWLQKCCKPSRKEKKKMLFTTKKKKKWSFSDQGRTHKTAQRNNHLRYPVPVPSCPAHSCHIFMAQTRNLTTQLMPSTAFYPLCRRWMMFEQQRPGAAPSPTWQGHHSQVPFPTEPRFWAAAAMGTELTNHDRDAGCSQFTLRIRALLP